MVDNCSAEVSSRDETPAGVAIRETLEGLKCPITHDLPADPTTAEDGFVYELAAIEAWFAQQEGPDSTSPMTNELIGKRLVPANTVRATIGRFVDAGLVHGVTAEAWKRTTQAATKKRLADEVANVQRLADAGNPQAMSFLGECYVRGMKGVTPDMDVAVLWLVRAARLNDARAMAMVGSICTVEAKAKIWCERAGTLGSQLGCLNAGFLYVNQACPDKASARKWFKRAARCERTKINDASVSMQQSANHWMLQNP